jgi:DNA-directed RNA polymerase specialized sigma24 family protein
MVNLYQMRQRIRNLVKLQWRVEQETAKATKITATITGMPRGSDNHSKVEDGAIRISDLKDAYREAAEELEAMKEALDPLISDLDNADDRAVMRLRYIKGFSPEDIAEAIHRTDRSIYYYLSRAEDQLVRKHPDKVSK